MLCWRVSPQRRSSTTVVCLVWATFRVKQHTNMIQFSSFFVIEWYFVLFSCCKTNRFMMAMSLLSQGIFHGCFRSIDVGSVEEEIFESRKSISEEESEEVEVLLETVRISIFVAKDWRRKNR